MSEIRTAVLGCAGGMPAFIAVPAAIAPAPVIVLMHERYGLVKHTRDLAERFAREGFAAIAPDCFFKHPDQAALHRGDVGYEMTDPEALDYLAAAIAALGGIPEADPARIAVMGVCQTGRHPLVLAAARPIAAALVWYGGAQPREWEVTAKYPRALEELIAASDCPVFGAFGETDHLISVADVRRLRDYLERHGRAYSLHLYRDAPHGWLNDTMPGRYRRAQAEEAWADQLEFLREVLAAGYDQRRRRQSYAADIAASYDFTRNLRFE